MLNGRIPLLSVLRILYSLPRQKNARDSLFLQLRVLYSFNYVLIYMLILLKNYTFYIEHRTIMSLFPPTHTFKVYTIFNMFPFKPLGMITPHL